MPQKNFFLSQKKKIYFQISFQERRLNQKTVKTSLLSQNEPTHLVTGHLHFFDCRIILIYVAQNFFKGKNIIKNTHNKNWKGSVKNENCGN